MASRARDEFIQLHYRALLGRADRIWPILLPRSANGHYLPANRMFTVPEWCNTGDRGMIAKTTIGICAALLALIAVPLSAEAQDNRTQTPLKQIGTPEAQRTETVPSLIVLNARGATLDGNTLTLLGAASNAII